MNNRQIADLIAKLQSPDPVPNADIYNVIRHKTYCSDFVTIWEERDLAFQAAEKLANTDLYQHYAHCCDVLTVCAAFQEHDNEF